MSNQKIKWRNQNVDDDREKPLSKQHCHKPMYCKQCSFAVAVAVAVEKGGASAAELLFSTIDSKSIWLAGTSLHHEGCAEWKQEVLALFTVLFEQLSWAEISSTLLLVNTSPPP